MEELDCCMCGTPIYGKKHIGICKDCIRKTKDEDLIKILKEYLESNPDAVVEEIIRDTGIPYSRIEKLESDDRIVLKKNMFLLKNGFVLDKKSKEQVGREMWTFLYKKEHEQKEEKDDRSKLVIDLEKKMPIKK